MTTNDDADRMCSVCGDGVPLCGPPPDAVWIVCDSCAAEGYTGEAGDDVRRATTT